jgi:hypothetical protein
LLNKVSVSVTLVDLSGANDLVLGVLNELIPMGQPASKARQGEHDGEHFGGDTKGLVDNAGVEINVGVKLAVDEVLVSQGNLFKGHSDIDHGFSANN